MNVKHSLALATLLALAACGSEEPTAAVEEATDATEGAAAAVEATVADAGGLCLDAGPQTPRDISSVMGLNTVTFDRAPASTEMNLCNIHTHTNAEHKGPGYSVFVNDTDSGGYACNETADLTEAELAPLDGAYKGAKPGDTIEVHWVHTSCPVTPGEGLGSCLTETCTDPLLRVEAQTFLVVNDPNAPDFMDYAYGGTVRDGFHQAKAIPSDTGNPVEFLGSTTGPSYDQSNCSPMKVTWSVRPMCKKVSMASLHAWAESGNVFNETKSHGVRQLVTAPELLSPIQ
ncbi:MAG: delta-class carbonic anhydrase [Woeseiaceae bacterium]|nr:delta-class carbonic anhydrase [Woeseiaceae bacterium]